MRPMIVDPDKVNLSEKDIEDWLYENPDALGLNVDRWIARQLEIPSGRLDLLGITEYGYGLVLVEVKNVEIGSDALTQVARYAFDISQISGMDQSSIIEVVIGKGDVSHKILAEAESMGICLKSFETKYSLIVSDNWRWTTEYRNKRNGMYEKLRETGIFDDLFCNVEEEEQDGAEITSDNELPEAFKDFLQGEQPDQPEQE